MKVKIAFAHMHQRGFIPGVNKQIEKGLDQRSCAGIQMWRLDNGDLECFYEGRHFFIPSVNFQALVVDEDASEAEVKTIAKPKENKKAA